MNSPNSILKRLEELKKWQESQQQKLIEQQVAQRELLMTEQKRMYEVLGISLSREGSYVQNQNETNYSHENVHHSDEQGTESIHIGEASVRYDEIEGISVLSDSSDADTQSPNVSPTIHHLKMRPLSIDEVSIVSPHKDFNSLLEHRLQDYVENAEKIKQSSGKQTKRPFLRKGQGLARFRINADTFKPGNIPKYKFANVHKERLKHQQRKAEFMNLNNNTLKPTEPCVNTRKSLGNINDNQTKKVIRPRSKSLGVEPESAQTFTENKPANTIKVKKIVTHNFPMRELKLVSSPPKRPVATWAKVFNPGNTVPHSSLLNNSLCEKVYKQQRDIDDLNIFELLEQKANDSSFCSTGSFVARLLDHKTTLAQPEIPKNILKLSPHPSEVMDSSTSITSHMNLDENTEIGHHVRFCDNVQVQEMESVDSDIESDPTSCSEASSVSYTSTPNRNPIPVFSRRVIESESDGSTTDGESKRNEDILGESTLTQTDITEMDSSESSDMTDGNNEHNDNITIKDTNTSIETNELETKTADSTNKQDIIFNGELLKTRLKELEHEIEIFRKENACVTRLKQDHEYEKIKFAKEKREIECKLNEEKLEIERYLNDEKEKLTKDKMIFDKYMKDLKNNPNRKEREEITFLKDKVAELQQEIKVKDSKSGAIQARLRTQIKHMEKDIETMKADIDVLKERNKKLVMSNNRYRTVSGTKMLQEINKKISSLSPNDIEVQTVVPQKKVPQKKWRQTKAVATVINHSLGTKKIQSLPAMRNENVCESHNKNKSNKKQIQDDTSVDETSSDSESEISEKISPQISDSSSSDEQMNTTQVQKDKSSYFPDCDEIKTVQADMGSLKRLSSKANLEQALNITDPRKPSVESMYEKEFNSTKLQCNDVHNIHGVNKREVVHADGRKETWYSNGNIKKLSKDGKIIKMIYFNGDVKETRVDEGVVKYFYAANKTWHTTYADGSEVLEFPNGQIEKQYKGGASEIKFPDGAVCLTDPEDQSLIDQWTYPDGTVVTNKKNGEKIIAMPNGQKEIHNQEHKRREYPDGTVKLVFPDGSQETRYSNGRVRIKDMLGNLIMDSEA